jgi:hypothetical protein
MELETEKRIAEDGVNEAREVEQRILDAAERWLDEPHEPFHDKLLAVLLDDEEQ